MKDLIEFYQENNSSSIGVVNAYLRLLEVYNELSISKLENLHPNQKHYRIKIFGTDILDEFENERSTGVISDSLDEEMQDLFDHHLMVIPIDVSYAYKIL